MNCGTTTCNEMSSQILFNLLCTWLQVCMFEARRVESLATTSGCSGPVGQMFGTTAKVHHVVFIASKRLHLGACKFEVSFQSVGCGCCEFFAPDMSHLQVNMQTWQVAHHKNSQKGSPQHKCLGTQHQATNFFTHQVLVQGRMSSPSTSWDDSVEAAVTLLAIRRGRQQLSKDVRMTDT